jgi:hypothetical protein
MLIGGKEKCSKTNVSQCYFVHHKSHVMDWPETEFGSPRSEADD